ncbi:MAG: S8 family serine peptidase [Candidatus Thiodiazotropha sp.]|nr:S8 family serine peptidase [Candidatus Thiodiazotropha taylori]MBT3060247.1 S8 family serine peptidase [Candidatus Thiodiazotropha sp. (ex Lucina pensylvanica)]MBV2096489.1 S8 family serine peptidase [Candidatus Thiodiazotropha sp. (ex Codakia orbicularis)]
MERHLRNQIERIIDEGQGKAHSVIIQMDTGKEETEELISIASQAIIGRNMFLSARDALPPPAEKLQRTTKASRGRKSRRRRLPDTKSMAEFVATMGFKATRKTIERAARRSLIPLLESDIAKRLVSDRKGARIGHFWSAASAVLELSKDDLARLPKDVPGIRDVFVNRPVTLPPVVRVDPARLPRTVQENKTSAWGVEAVGALATWGAYGAKGSGVKVAVLDTGIDADHPDLQGRITTNDFAEFDSDGNTVDGAAVRDTGRHGTHCCGTVAGGNASGHWIGVAPEVSLAAGVVLPRGRGTDAQILAGMQWAIDRDVDVISMSLGGLSMSPEVLDTYTRMIITANRLGISVVVAIGNEGSQTSGAPGNDYFAFTVGATDAEDRAAGFSGGRTQVINESRYIRSDALPLVYSKPDVSAPGVGVKSAVPRGRYEAWNGTSMATPHVAGAIALLLSATDIRSNVAANERAYLIQDLIMGSVEELGEAGQDHRFGLGRINILKAIGFAKELGY